MALTMHTRKYAGELSCSHQMKKMWQAMEIGQTKPTEAPADWDDAKIKTVNFNSRALNALFSAIMIEEFKKISSIETVKEAWTILQTTYEGTKDDDEKAQGQNWAYS